MHRGHCLLQHEAKIALNLAENAESTHFIQVQWNLWPYTKQIFTSWCDLQLDCLTVNNFNGPIGNLLCKFRWWFHHIILKTDHERHSSRFECHSWLFVINFIGCYAFWVASMAQHELNMHMECDYLWNKFTLQAPFRFTSFQHSSEFVSFFNGFGTMLLSLL